MSPFINYLIEANLSICFFLLIYKMLLSKETDHLFNRAFLLLSLVISMTLPFFHFEIPSLLVIGKELQTYGLPEIKITPLKESITQVNSFWFWISSIYFLGTATFFALFLIHLLKIGKAVYQSPIIKNGPVWLIELKDEGEVFSFFKFIFIGKLFRLTETEKQQIVRHEQVHINNYHSFDILIINLIGVLFWFNPFVKTYRKLFVQLHEFEADARSVESYEVNEYCSLLAKAALHSSGYQLANHFTNSLTLKRIEMMKTIKTKIKGWKVASILVTAFAFCLVVGCDNRPMNNSDADEIFAQVDELPTFGSKPEYTELYEYIGKNLTYPEEAKKSNIEGKVFVEFVVEKDGSLSNIKAMKGIGHGCDEEVVRVIKSLPRWNPGEKDGKIVRTKFTIPIVFRLPVSKKETN